MKKFKCIFVHTPQLTLNQNGNVCSNINFSAMGLYSLANELNKEGFPTKIIHLGIEKYLDKKFLLSDYINQNDIKFVAFSLHWHPQSYDVIETARVVKERNPDIFLTIGGFTASYFAIEIMEKFPFVDAIIKGEGELPIVELAKEISSNKSLKTVPNLVWRKSNKIITNKNTFVASNKDLDSYEFFKTDFMKNFESYSKVPFYMEYSKPNQLNNQMTTQGVCLGRGCTGNCTWCGGGCNAIKMVTGRDFVSYRNPDNVIKEIKSLQKEHHIERFLFSFDPKPNDRKYLYELLTQIAKEFGGRLNATFSFFGLPDKKILDLFKQAFSKASVALISPEFYNEDLRKKHKSFYFSNKELEKTLDYMEQLQIHSEIYFAIIPNVPDEENKKSEEYAKELQDRYKMINKHYIIPIVYEPASPWTINPKKFGFDIKQKNFEDYYNDTKNIKNSFENREIFSEKDLYVV